MARTALDTNEAVGIVPLCYARDTMKRRQCTCGQMKTEMPLVVARPLVCVISWRLAASLLGGLRWSSGGLVLCRLGYLDRCLDSRRCVPMLSRRKYCWAAERPAYRCRASVASRAGRPA
jgi:hypothetical protein